MPVAEKKTTAERLLDGDRNAVARLITWAENGDARFVKAQARLYPEIGRAARWGLTGPPGVGKSTLVNELVLLLRAEERTVGVLAVDPSSPFTGGALLGDRIRMDGHTRDRGVFIRSMASRKSHGGLARGAIDACDVMDAFGFDELLIETVGVGQAEYDVVSAADTVLVVLCPGAGDGIQAMKSGLLEVADVIVVNKNDCPGADRLVLDLEEAVHIRWAGRSDWVAPVVRCSAGYRQGIDEVLAAVRHHQEHLAGERLAARRVKMRLGQVRNAVGEMVDEALWGPDGYDPRVYRLLEEGNTPYDIAGALRDEILDGRLPSAMTEKEVT
jgi:LAO/AO transport system kinase